MTKSTPHAVLVAYPQASPVFADIKDQISNYNRRNSATSGLRISAVVFDDDTGLVLVKGFEDSRAAQQYEAKLNGETSPLAALGGGFQLIVISLENLPRFYQARDLTGYQTFYDQAYQQEP